jgi:hypothetical protein
MARIWKSPFVRLAAYYVLLSLAVVSLLALFPALRDLFARAQELSSIHGVSKSKAIEEAATSPGIASLGFRALGLLTVLSMLGALVLVLPTAWVYMVTKQHRGYDQSVVQTVIVLPMTIAGTLILVQNSLALAFALGGIVAAIRFRNTLRDTKDVVYVYLALGVGMSAGVFVPVVSAAMSLVFNYTLLTLWHFNVGNIYAHQTLTGRLQLGQAIVAPNAKTGEYQVIGNPELLRALAPEEFDKVAAASDRLQRYIVERASKKPFNTLLLVHATALEPAQQAVKSVLDEFAKRWELREILPAGDGRSTLEYLVRLAKDTALGPLLEQVKRRGAPHVLAAEYRSLRGLRNE